SYTFSGAENVVCQVIDMFKEDSNIEMVYCSRDGAIREELENRNIEFIALSRLSVTELKRVIAEYQPNIIHAHDVTASIIAGLAAGKTTVISHMHVNHENMSKLNKKTLLYILSTIKYKHIFWVSNSAYDNYYFHRNIKSKSTVLYNVMNQDSVIEKMRKDTETYNFDVVYVGRLAYQKNPERLIKVLNKLVIKNPKIKIAIVGVGNLLENTKKSAHDYGIQNNIEFLGYQSNPLKILKDAKVMVMTSRYEGTPMCALEAMALGVPIVSTPADGMSDLVLDNYNGFLSDNDDMLADKIHDIVNNINLRNRLSTNSIKMFIENNDLNEYKEILKNVYQR
ncbi:MAG: glycosyltransferase, partial [Oscillospiraceae bacterium]